MPRISSTSVKLLIAGISFLPLLACLAVEAFADTEKNIPTPPYSLQECYQLALATSERLKRSEQDIHIAEADYRQVMSAIYPQVSLDVTQNFRDNSDFGRIPIARNLSLDDPASPTGGRSGSLGRTQFETTVSVVQPIFTGFREYLLGDALKQDTAALRFDLQRNRELLYQDVAALYWQILGASADLQVLGKSGKTIGDRIRELDKFRTLGKSRDSEVLAAKADQEDLEASKARSTGVERAAKELLAFLTGVPAASLELERSGQKDLRGDVNSYLTAIQKRFDVKSSEQRVLAQQQRVTAAERGKWPGVDVVGTAFPLEDPDRNREYEILLRLSLPIFDGGLTESRTAEELARLQSADLLLLEKRRAAESDVRAAYERAAAGQEERKRLQQLLQAAERSYESQKKDYEFGVVSNLEVLQAIRQLQEAERRFVSSSYIFMNNVTELEVAAGGIVP